MKIRCLRVACLTGLLLAGPIYAQLDVDEQIDTAREELAEVDYHFSRGWLDEALTDYDEVEASRDDLDYYFYISPMYQFADGKNGADQQANYSIGTFFNWTPIQTENHEGALRLWLDFSEIAHGEATKNFSRNLGLQQLTNDISAKTSKAKIGQIYWDSKFLAGQFEIQAGHMDPFLQFGVNPYAYWDRNTGIAQALSTDVVSPWGDAGLGLIGTVNFSEGFYAKIGALDSDASGQYPDFSSLSNGRWQYTAEVGRDGMLGGQASVIRLNYSEAPRKGEFKGGTGWSLNIAQDVSDRFAIWARLADAPKPRQDFKQQYGGGLVIKKPFGYDSDQIGLGVVRTEATDSSLRDETAIELMWKMQLTARLRFTPALTLYLDPARDESASELVVGTVRFFIKL